VAENAGSVVTRGGLSVNQHHRLAGRPRPDLLLVPVGQGTRKEMHNPALMRPGPLLVETDRPQAILPR